MTTTRRLRRVERELRGRAHRGDLHRAAIRAWLTARDSCGSGVSGCPRRTSAHVGGSDESRSEARRRQARLYA
jgi:hypothetical protein